jgi:hypothetical protein
MIVAIRNVLILLGVVLIFQGCYYDKASQLYPAPYCDTTSITFSGTITPIFSSNCISGCHDAATQAGGYDFSTYAGIKASIVPSNRLIGAINQQNGYYAMPQSGGKLSSCDIDKINAWVDQGYPNN